jgi:hypothetical protein
VDKNIRGRWWRSNVFNGGGDGQRQGDGEAAAAKMDLNGGRRVVTAGGGV